MPSCFSRIKNTRASELSGLATHRGIAHETLGEGEFVVFKFDHPRSKLAFDKLCQENDVQLDGERSINLMVDAVVSGKQPAEVLDEAGRRKMQITHGMARHFSRGKAKYFCSNCALTIPVYPGAYPSSCPTCGGDLQPPEGA